MNKNTKKAEKGNAASLKSVPTQSLPSFSSMSVIDFSKIKKDDESDVELMHDDEVETDLLEVDEAPSREILTGLDEPDIEIEYPLLTETHPPGGIPVQCENELMFQYKWYKSLRCWFLVSDNWVVQSGIVRGYLGLYHERFLHLLSFPYIIHPFSNFYCAWNSTICFLLAVSLIVEPYIISFQCFDFVSSINKTCNLTMSVLLMLDMALTFIVGRADPKYYI
ncbi:unnamed protein product [Orchesella dallaii]|uniref:Uncharacterized protein n=1 Tax=Orchesella dallaii TaxID=48710 RepID=A0ABP1RGC1_9HEXA